ncbi:MAG TPA: hypothetical protein VGS99_01390 [Gammaproteobacteria bacterium]|nr:hypothetical protein [Gammaproteobacteria bacterium]
MGNSRFFIVGLLALGSLLFTAASYAIDIPQGSGEYAKIDTQLARSTLKALQGTAAQQNAAVAAVLKSPKDYEPQVFYALSSVLFAKGRRDEAAFWFYAGQLRAKYDANRCADDSASQELSILNDQYGLQINQYAMRSPDFLQKTIASVVAWDKATPHDYDPRWINLYGFNATQQGADPRPPLFSQPKAQWDQIAEMTRRDYQDSFDQAIAKMKAKPVPAGN